MSSESSSRSMSLDTTSRSTAPSSVSESKTECPISTTYSKWRPTFHVQPQSGWLNDPCAPGYDPRTKQYHLSFQHNPKGPDWGDICWSSMISHDLVHWKAQSAPTLLPEEPYDAKGVFTGCLVPHSGEVDEPMTVAYTSVNALPIHHTLAHIKGSESLSLAQSYDHGVTWKKLSSNPILPSEPENIEVTGWRDPYVASWPRMNRILGTDTLFGIISGGIRGATPTTFLYSVDRQNLTQWQYLGPLVDFGLNLKLSRWSGDFGKNWEVTNFMTLSDENNVLRDQDFLVMGTEGCYDPSNNSITTHPRPSRPARGQLWMAGSLLKQASQAHSSSTSATAVDMACQYSGFLDHGCLYAANTFFDPVSQSQIAWGWITEEDLCDELRHAQGWSGLLSLPRELFIQALAHVTGTIGPTPLDKITSVEAEPDQCGSFTVRTLASRPVQRVVQHLRQNAAAHTVELRTRKLIQRQKVLIAGQDISSQAWELDCSFRVSSECRRVGVRFLHSACSPQKTTLAFHPLTETFTIERPSLPLSDSQLFINSSPESAPHTLFTFRDPVTGTMSTEPLHIRVWRDNSVLEVFVNDRTAISTRIFAAESTFGIEFFADEEPLPWPQDAKVGCVSVLISATFRDGIGIR